MDLWRGWKRRLLAGPPGGTIGSPVEPAEGSQGAVVRDEQDVGGGRHLGSLLGCCTLEPGPTEPPDLADIHGVRVAGIAELPVGVEDDLARHITTLASGAAERATGVNGHSGVQIGGEWVKKPEEPGGV